MSGQLNIRVDDELKRAFINKAKSDGSTATDLLVEFMRQYLGLVSNPNLAIEAAAIEASIRESIDNRLAESEVSIRERLDNYLSEVEARIAALENQQSGELAALESCCNFSSNNRYSSNQTLRQSAIASFSAGG